MRTRCELLLTLLFGLLLPAAAAAQWAANGNPVCTATGAQNTVSIAANGLAGAVMVWQDNRGASTDIYARQIGFLGPAEWTSNGVALCTAAGNQLNPHVVHDGFGYLLYTWEDYRSGNADMYAAITDRLGNVFTPANGFAISSGVGDQDFSSLTTNGLGMGYVAWADSRSGHWDIYAQAFNNVNHAFWTANGLPVCTFTSDQINPVVAPDGTDGVYVVWEDLRNSNQYDIYAQHVNISGQLLWATNGAGVCTQGSAQVQPMAVSDGAGGVFIAWLDQRNGVNTEALYGQHVNATGTPLWATNGISLAASTDLMNLPRMIPDGAGGAILAWEDFRNVSTNGGDIYAQRVNGAGTVLWGTNGVAVCTAPQDQSSVDIASDGAGGVIATWQDVRAVGSADLYAQRINAAGGAVWAANGIPVCTAANNQLNPAIAQSETGGVILGWEDRRTGGVADVYADRIDVGTGLLGYPAPYITSIVDVPNDEGGWVRVTLRAPDEQPTGNEFTVFDNEYHGGDMVWLGTYDGSPSYTFDVITEGIGVPNHYWVDTPPGGNVAVGISIDNLAPPAPTLTGQRNGANVSLSWNSTAGDIANYTIVRTDVGTLNTVTTTSYTDLNTPHAALHYRVHATDIHGNVGPESNELVIPDATGVAELSAGPSALTVLPNSPNPFSGSTAFRFGMPHAGRVQLEVFDAAGRRVASRDLGELPAGWRDLAVEGRDDAGRLLASGVYFCRVSAGGETRTSKMVVRR